jgi:hypothetical protein
LERYDLGLDVVYMCVKGKDIYGNLIIYEEWCLLGCYAVWLVRTDVSEEPSASIIRVTTIGELGTTLAATSNRRTQGASVASCS